MKRGMILQDQKGVALVIALLLLLVLTIVGLNAIGTTSFENIIAGNDRVRITAFYASEAGLQKGFLQLPDTEPLQVTAIGKDSSFWSGTVADKKSPKSLGYRGLAHREGYDRDWAFKRFQINVTGEHIGGSKELEAQASFGPIRSGTEYN